MDFTIQRDTDGSFKFSSPVITLFPGYSVTSINLGTSPSINFDPTNNIFGSVSKEFKFLLGILESKIVLLTFERLD